MGKQILINLFRAVAFIVALVGAIVSVSLVLYKGRNNESVLLIGLFVVWVITPFIALLIANVVSKAWSDTKCIILYSLKIVITIGSLLSYSGVFSPAGTKTAFVFLVTPLISWIFLAIGLLISWLLSKRLTNI